MEQPACQTPTIARFARTPFGARKDRPATGQRPLLRRPLRRLCYHASRNTMKLMRYSRRHEPSSLSRLGVLVGGELIADLRAGYALYLVDEMGHRKGRELAQLYVPSYIAQFLHVGEPAWLALGDAYSYLAELVGTSPGATGLAGEQLFLPVSECRLYAPVRPSKLIAIGRNYPGYTRNP